MKLQDINKVRYQKHLKTVMAGMVISLAILGVSFGQLLISLLSDGNGSNFYYNLVGVVLAAALCLKVVHSIRHHDFMTEVYYVWQLKQALNSIYRKLKKIQQARDEDNINALIVLNFYYAASEQLFTLDDNTITMDSLKKDKAELQSLIETKNLQIKTDDYTSQLLKDF